jgi:hypothetical protein
MLKGFAYTTPTQGRISIGRTVEHGGKNLPKKEDFITITSQVKRDGEWLAHPLHERCVKDQKLEAASPKLRQIPVRLMFNDPDLSFREQYEAFLDSRQVCVGDGETARRRLDGRVEEIACPGPDNCQFAAVYRCQPFGRLNVQIEGQDDPLATFIFRTRGWNSIRTLRTKLEYLKAALGGKLAGLPLLLVMRAKSARLSLNTPFFFLDLVFRDATPTGIAQAVKERDAHVAALKEAGFDFEALEAAARSCLRNGAFEETEEDLLEYEDLVLSSTGPNIGADGAGLVAAAPDRARAKPRALAQLEAGLPPQSAAGAEGETAVAA